MPTMAVSRTCTLDVRRKDVGTVDGHYRPTDWPTAHRRPTTCGSALAGRPGTDRKSQASRPRRAGLPSRVTGHEPVPGPRGRMCAHCRFPFPPLAGRSEPILAGSAAHPLAVHSAFATGRSEPVRHARSWITSPPMSKSPLAALR
jgi:hypothetical protein